MVVQGLFLIEQLLTPKKSIKNSLNSENSGDHFQLSKGIYREVIESYSLEVLIKFIQGPTTLVEFQLVFVLQKI